MHIEVHDMTEQHKNIDTHECVKGYFLNRVSGKSLSSEKPQAQLQTFDNGSFLFSTRDHTQQRENYIDLVSRVITRDIPCLQFLSDAVVQHIPHT